MDWRADMYPAGTGQYSVESLAHHTSHESNQYPEESAILNRSPWHSQYLQDDSFGAGPGAGCVAFEPNQGPTFDAYLMGEQFLENHHPDQLDSKAIDLEPLSPAGTEEWQVVPSYPSSSIPSHESPHSEGSPWSRISTPPLNSASPPAHSETHADVQAEAHTEDHGHIFSAYPGIAGPKLPRGRQRALTSQEKREALDVRKAKACWACHLSKIKCSPCSPGTPCQQCERLSGKRRFCWLPCFNDPLESLQPFLAPEYLFSNFTQAKVEWFVNQNAAAWGNHEMTVQMYWGHSRPLQARVVTITLIEDSQLAYVSQIEGSKTQREAIIRKSPPLGLPLASMGDMKDEYSSLVQEIVMNNPNEYVSIAYDDQESDLAQQLLQAVSNFYSAGLAAGDEVTDYDSFPCK